MNECEGSSATILEYSNRQVEVHGMVHLDSLHPEDLELFEGEGIL